MRISTVGYSAKQGVKNIGRNKMFSLASVATMAACIFVFGLFFSIIMNFQYIVHKAEEGVAITVFFNDDATQEQIDNIGAQLKKQDGVKEIKYVSADEAWETFKDQYFGESSDLAEGFKNDNPLAGSDNYEVYMTDVASQKKLVSFAESLDGVRKVNKSDTVANTLNSVNKLVWYVSVVIIAILLAVSIFLISNTVTMGITVRREEIAIMKYIGAKDGFVRAPFIIEGILIGLVGAAIPLGILYVLYNKAIEFAGLTGKERVIDAYSGIGTIGMVASDNAGEVISVELNGDAVRDAVFNAKQNKVKNIRFYKEDAGDFMVKMASHKEKADVVFMDPPRAGSDKKFLDSLLRLKPKKIVYISCNPETLARDLEFFKKHQYTAEKIQPVDMFPFTTHMETVCLLTRRK